MNYNKGAILRSIEQPFIKDDLPEFDTGDTVRVDYKVVEGTRSRVQAFEGVVIAQQNGKGARASFTVRKVSFGEGVERVFPLHSPLIDKIVIVRRGRTRRAKLYYLRELRGKAARLKTDVGRQEADRAVARAARDASGGKKRKGKAAQAESQPETPPADTAQTDSVQADTVQADDLTRIEGVGPKFSEALVEAGIATYADVANSSEDAFVAALTAADLNNPASTSTWSKQAQFLVDGDEEGLKAYQDELEGGREVK